MPSPSEHPFGPHDNDGLNPDDIRNFDPLLAELRSPNFDRIRLETAVGLFVEDFEEDRQVGESGEHPSLETISDYLSESAAENYADLGERFRTIRSILKSEIPKHTDNDDVANGALQSMCAVVFSDVGSCLTAQTLSVVLESYDNQVYSSHIEPFREDVAGKVLRLTYLKHDTLVPLQVRDEEARKIQDVCERNATLLLTAVDRGEQNVRASFSLLVGRAMERLTQLEPDISHEFIEMLQEQLLKVYQDDFNQRISAIAQEQRDVIEEVLSTIGDGPPPAAQPTP